MFQKIFLIIGLFFVSGVQAEYEDSFLDDQFQELVYCMGMSLAQQDTIHDDESAQNALINIVEDVPAIGQILQLFLSFNQEMVANNIDSIPMLIEYEVENHLDLAFAGIIWLAAFQKVFVIFNKLHPYDASFAAWSSDMEYLESWTETSQFEEDPDYANFWQACIDMIKAQDDFYFEFKALEEPQK